MNDVTHGDLGDLARLGARDVRNLDDDCGHVPRARAVLDLQLDLLAQGVIEGMPLVHDDEQNHANVAIPGLPDDNGFLDLVELLDLPVNFGGSDPHPARIERRV